MTTTYDQSTVTYDQSDLNYIGLPPQFDNTYFAVEMAFGSNPLDTSPSWETVTPYVRGFTINRGRNSEFSTYGPGTASIALDNRDRRFDPEHTTGPYFGELNPMVPVRVQVTRSGTTWTMFYGFVQGWPTIYNQSNTDAVASVTAIDATRLLGNMSLPQSPYVELLNASFAADLYYPMQESGGVFRPLKAPGAVADYEIPYGPSTQTQLGAPIGATAGVNGGLSKNFGFALPLPYSISFWAVVSAGRVFVLYSTSTGMYIDLEVGTASAALTVRIKLGRNVSFTGTTSLSISEGVHQIVLSVVVAGTSGFNLYVDGVSVWSAPITTTYLPTITLNRLNASSGAINHFTVWDTSLSAGFAGDLYDYGLIPFRGELSSARLTRTLDDSGWPTAWRDIQTGVQPVGSYRPESLSAARYFPQIDNAEQGSLFVNREGEVEFRSRSTAEAVLPVGLFDDSGTDLPFANVAVDAHTVDAIRNRVVGTYAFGSVTAVDATSVTAYGEASETVDIGLIDDVDDAQSIVDARLARAKDPRTRVTRLDVNVRRDPAALVPVVAALDLSDDVTVSLTPTGVGSALWRAVRVQGLSHTVTPQSWDVSLYLAPGPINTNGPLLVLDDGTYGVLDSNKLG